MDQRFNEPWTHEVCKPQDFKFTPQEEEDMTAETWARTMKQASKVNAIIWGVSDIDRPPNKMGKIVAFTPPRDPAEADRVASRITACVNAMEGIEDPEKTIGYISKLLDQLTQGEWDEELIHQVNMQISQRINKHKGQ